MLATASEDKNRLWGCVSWCVYVNLHWLMTSKTSKQALYDNIPKLPYKMGEENHTNILAALTAQTTAVSVDYWKRNSVAKFYS